MVTADPASLAADPPVVEAAFRYTFRFFTSFSSDFFPGGTRLGGGGGVVGATHKCVIYGLFEAKSIPPLPAKMAGKSGGKDEGGRMKDEG
jgi:hypothetical protein